MSTRLLALFLLLSLATATGVAEGGYLKLDDARLYFETQGEGECLVLLHGALQDLRDWGTVAATLAERFHVVALDSRGQGRSSISETALSYELLADDVLALLDHLKVERAHVVGLSDGANTALALAMKRPERLLSIVCVGANARTDETAVDPRMHEMVRNQDIEQLARQMAQKYSEHPNPERLSEFLVNMQKMILTQPSWDAEALGAVLVPTLVMSGDRDFIRQEHTVEIYRALPNAALCIVPSTGHTVPQERPTLFTTLVLDFVEAHAGAQ